MLHKPYRYRDKDDDYAPVDYSYVPSVGEGRRRQQLQGIHKEPERTVVRHRADPYERETVDDYGTRAPKMIAPASRIAYPEDSAIPENPFDPSGEQPRPVRTGRGERTVQPEPEPMVTQDGSQFDPPAMAQLPEWYRIAQQNSMPRDERRVRAPRVQAAPRLDAQEEEPPVDLLGRPLRAGLQRNARRGAPAAADAYEEAGYPQELLERQREVDFEQDIIARRKRHGAQYAVNEYRQEEYERSTGGAGDQRSYPPSRAEYARRRVLSDEEREQRALAASRALDADDSPRERGAAYAAASSRERGYAARAGEPYEPDENPYAQNPYAVQRDLAYAPQRVARRQTTRPPQVDEEEPDAPAPAARLPIPWLAVALFAAAALAVGLWLMQLNYTSQLERIRTERYQAEMLVRDKHPYEYRSLIEREAAKYNLNPAFVAAIVLNESSFRPDAESSVGARGLMQVMAETAGDIGREMNVSNYSFDMLYDAETNVAFGCYYLGKLSERFRGDPVLVAAAYHAGAGEVQNWLNNAKYSLDGTSLVLENMEDGPTKQYATRVKRDFAVYKRLYYERMEDDA